MRKILFFFLFIAGIGLLSNAQFPNGPQYLGNSKTLVEDKGGFKATGGLINGSFTDTATANSAYIKSYPGAQIRINNDIYVRNTDATGWVKQLNIRDTSTFNQRYSREVNNIAELRKFTGNSSDTLPMSTKGYYTAGDGGGSFFIWSDTSTHADDGGKYIKPSSVSGAGRWVAQFENNIINLLQFGARAQFTGYFGNEGQDNRQILMNAIYALTEMTVFIYKYRIGTIYIPGNEKGYYMSDSIIITQSVRIIGDDPKVTNIVFPADKSGFVLLFNSGSDYAADMEISYMMLSSTSYLGYSTKSGIRSNTRFKSHYLSVNAFAGDGWVIDAASPTNANLCDLYYPSATNCRGSGFYFQGGDANQMRIYGLNSTNNYRWGVYDNSFLGNQYFSPHVSENAYVAGNKTLVSHNGNWYGAYEANTNVEPGVASGWEDYWQYLGVGAVNTYYTAWSAAENYVGGGSIYCDNANQQGAFYGNYIEYGQNLARSNGNTIFYDGVGYNQVVQGTKVGSQTNGYFSVSSLETPVNDDNVKVRLSNETGSPVIGFYDGTNGVFNAGLAYWQTNKVLTFAQNSSILPNTQITTTATSGTNYGRASAPQYNITTNGIWFDKGSSTYRMLGMRDAAPTTGTYAAGDYYLYSGTDSTILSFTCTVSGTPGTWFTKKTGNLAGGYWPLTGLAPQSGISEFLGTTSNRSLRFRTNNTEYAILDSNGRFGIGTMTPALPFHLYESTTNTTTAGGRIENAGNGDAVLHFLRGTQNYSAGIDQSGSDRFKISASATLGTNNGIEIASDGSIGFAGANVNGKVSFPAGGTGAFTGQTVYTSGSILTTAAAGVKEYNGTFYETKGSGLRYSGGGTTVDFYTDANNSGTGETDLYSYTTPANALASDGEKITFSYTVTLNDNTSTAQLQVYFAGTSVANTGALTVTNTGTVVVKGWIVRTGATTARVTVNISSPTTSTAESNYYTALTSLTLSGTNILKITGQAGGGGGGSNDITATMGSVRWDGKADD